MAVDIYDWFGKIGLNVTFKVCFCLFCFCFVFISRLHGALGCDLTN